MADRGVVNAHNELVTWALPDNPFNADDWTEIGEGVHIAPVGTPLPATTTEQFTDLTTFAWELGLGDFLDEMTAEDAFNLEHAECSWTAPEPRTIVLSLHDVGPELWCLWATGGLERALLFDSKLLAPPKRPPDPERPFWAVRPGHTRRNAFRSTRRAK